MPSQYVHGHHPKDEISLLDLWKVIEGNRKIIFYLSLITTTIALIIAILSTPVYRAESLLSPVTKDGGNKLSALAGQFGGLASLAGIDLGGGSSAVEAIEILKSRDFIIKFIESEKLMPVLYESLWDAEKKIWKDNVKVPSILKAYEKFSKSVQKVSVDPKTTLVTLAIEWKDPEKAADWTIKLVERINDKLRSEAIAESEKSIQYLENELKETSVIDIKQSIYNLIEAQAKNKMLANTRQEFAFRVIDSAVVPEERVRPNRKLIVLFGMLIGVILGIFVGFFRHFLRQSSE